MNMACVLNLPVVFMFENNGYAEFTAASYATAGSIEARAKAYGMPATTVAGDDFFAVHEAAREAIAHARAGNGPFCIEAKAYRFHGHFSGDPQAYRSKEELESVRADHDCLKIFRTRVTEAALLDESDMNAIDKEILSLIDEAVDEAKAAPEPTEADLYTDVYATYQ
jgi:pyruvate dehydrogenase E1 component alpha subunit